MCCRANLPLIDLVAKFGGVNEMLNGLLNLQVPNEVEVVRLAAPDLLVLDTDVTCEWTLFWSSIISNAREAPNVLRNRLRRPHVFPVARRLVSLCPYLATSASSLSTMHWRIPVWWHEQLAIECDAWVGTLASNWCILIDELRATVALKAAHPLVDVGFRCFQGCED